MPMTPQFSTITLASFHLWLDNWLTQRGQAYTNTTSRLYYQADPQRPGFVAYASPFRSWVCDSGVSGATVPSIISGSLGVLGRGQSGLIFDYENGRVLLNAGVGTGAILSGSYAFKDLNVYKANETQEEIIFANKYYLNSRFARPVTGVPPPYDMVTPCVFVTDTHSENEGWALGGLYNTKRTVTLIVMAENLLQQEGVMSLATDAKDVGIPQLPLSAWPLSFYGDYKSGSGYNYEATKQQYGQPGNLFTVTDVRATTVGDGAKVNPGVFLSLIDFTLEKPRIIH